MPASLPQVLSWSLRQLTAQAAVAAGDVWQMPDGRAAVNNGSPVTSGSLSQWATAGQFTMPKAAVNLLDGGRAYWDRSAAVVTFRPVLDRDFYLGRVVGEAAVGDANCVVSLNTDPRYDRELRRDPFRTVAVGTQALGGFQPPQPRGGALKLAIDATNEAQKVDALGKDGWAVGAKAVIEFAVELVSNGAGGAPDFNIGIASGTHATDFDSITAHLALHLDGNSLTAKVQSADGTHTTAAVTTGTAVVAGVRSEFWFDCRIPSAVKIYQDGIQVLSGTTFNISSAAGALYLIAHLEKTAAADVFDADVDWLRAQFMEQSGP